MYTKLPAVHYDTKKRVLQFQKYVLQTLSKGRLEMTQVASL